MKSQYQYQVLGVPRFYKLAISMKEPALEYVRQSDARSDPSQVKAESRILSTNKSGKKVNNFASVRLAFKITEIIIRKLSLRAKVLRVGGMQKIFRQLFTVDRDEKLLKASQCYLSTTSGSIGGLLFISTSKVAFCSERSIELSSKNGNSIRVHYKVLIPIEKIRRLRQSENVKKPSEKYMEIVTVDDFDFWFMGFLNYKKTFNMLQKLSHRLISCDIPPRVLDNCNVYF